MSDSTIEDRLKSVITSLEDSQSRCYSPITNLVLSYLSDILNDKVPDYVLEISNERNKDRSGRLRIDMSEHFLFDR